MQPFDYSSDLRYHNMNGFQAQPIDIPLPAHLQIYGSSADNLWSDSSMPSDTVPMESTQTHHSWDSDYEATTDPMFDDHQYIASTSESPVIAPPLYYHNLSAFAGEFVSRDYSRPDHLDPVDLGPQSLNPQELLVENDPVELDPYECSDLSLAGSYNEQPPNGPPTSEIAGFKCSYENCSSTGRFTRKTDLKRHIRSLHTAKKFDCEHKWCGRVGARGFARRDHYREHLRDFHLIPIPKSDKRRSRR